MQVETLFDDHHELLAAYKIFLCELTMFAKLLVLMIRYFEMRDETNWRRANRLKSILFL